MNTKTLIILLMMAAGVPVFYMQFAPQDVERELEVHLVELRRLDHQINSLVMRSRLGIDRSYDDIAKVSSEIDRLQETVAGYESAGAGSSGKLSSLRLGSYMEVEQNKQSVIENFKSHNSVLRNSVTYAPFAADRLIVKVQGMKLTEEADLLRSIKSDLMEYNVTGSKATRGQIARKLSKLSSLEQKLPQEEVVKLISFVNHANVIIQEKEVTDRYMEKAIQSQTKSYLDVAIQQVQELQGMTAKDAYFRQLVTLVYLGTFAAVLLFQAVTMQRRGASA